MDLNKYIGIYFYLFFWGGIINSKDILLTVEKSIEYSVV